jgi:hypothetical protein
MDGMAGCLDALWGAAISALAMDGKIPRLDHPATTALMQRVHINWRGRAVSVSPRIHSTLPQPKPVARC